MKATQFLSTEESLKNRKWVLVDAAGQRVGRIATQIAAALRGKNNPKFTPHNDCGDFVVVVNADKIEFSGQKLANKIYHKHTGYVGHLQETSAEDMLATKPEEIIRLAVRGMLPKSALGRNQLKKLKIYTGAEHPHAAQIN